MRFGANLIRLSAANTFRGGLASETHTLVYIYLVGLCMCVWRYQNDALDDLDVWLSPGWLAHRSRLMQFSSLGYLRIKNS